MQRVRDPEAFIPKWVVSIKSLPTEFREPYRRKQRECKLEGMEDTKKTRPSKST